MMQALSQVDDDLGPGLKDDRVLAPEAGVGAGHVLVPLAALDEACRRAAEGPLQCRIVQCCR